MLYVVFLLFYITVEAFFILKPRFLSMTHFQNFISPTILKMN